MPKALNNNFLDKRIENNNNKKKTLEVRTITRTHCVEVEDTI